MNQETQTKFFKIASLVLALALFFLLFEVEVSLGDLDRTADDSSATVTTTETETQSETTFSSSRIIPTGTPEVYGAELDVNYDDVSADDPRGADATIEELAQLDRNLTLEGDDLERYIHILYEKEDGMSCEFCCGARSIIFENGDPACGCAHSFAMRGLAKHLILEHGDEMTDEEILAEVGKWKILFFPGQHTEKASMMEEEGTEVDYVSLTANTYRGIEQGSAGGGMVGGC